MRLQDKVIVVTGGADGIGFALAAGIAREGATAVIADIDQEKLECSKHALRASGLSCEGYCMDVSRREEIDRVVSDLLHRFGRIDGWVNNAGGFGKEIPAGNNRAGI